jgi:hypothetical protein
MAKSGKGRRTFVRLSPALQALAPICKQGITNHFGEPTRRRFQAVGFRGADRCETQWSFCANNPVKHPFSHFLETFAVFFGRTRYADNIFRLGLNPRSWWNSNAGGFE